jgi:hypothetical protein
MWLIWPSWRRWTWAVPIIHTMKVEAVKKINLTKHWISMCSVWDILLEMWVVKFCIEYWGHSYLVYTVEPVYSDIPRDQRNMSDCTGCRNTQGFILVNGNDFGLWIFVECHRMSENSGVGLHKFHSTIFNYLHADLIYFCTKYYNLIKIHSLM